MSVAKTISNLLPEGTSNKFLNKLKRVKWMNECAKPSKAYVPTPIEHIANVITHGVWILPSIIGSVVLILRSKNLSQLSAAIVYGLSLVSCFSVSTCFHSAFYCRNESLLKDLLHRGDRAIIYFFIAGSYFPWLVLRPSPEETWHAELWWIIWVLATCGIVYQQIFHEKYKSLETLFYLIVGVGPSVGVIGNHPLEPGASQLITGGVLYVFGIFFFKSDGKVPFAHAIWHLFVAGAALVHYIAVLEHLFA